MEPAVRGRSTVVGRRRSIAWGGWCAGHASGSIARLNVLGKGLAITRILDIARHLRHETLERMRSARRQVSARIAVGVDVRHQLGIQLIGVLLAPFGGADQTELLAVPEG